MIIVLVGSSRVGKTYLSNLATSAIEGLTPLATYTSREPRAEEVDGVDYHFVGREYFEKHSPDFVEFQEFNGKLYGSKPPEDFREQDYIVILTEEGAKMWVSFATPHIKVIRILKGDSTKYDKRSSYTPHGRYLADFWDYYTHALSPKYRASEFINTGENSKEFLDVVKNLLRQTSS